MHRLCRTAKLRGLLDLGQELGVQVEVVRLEDLLLPEGQVRPLFGL